MDPFTRTLNNLSKETELDPSESGTSARAAMLFLMAKEAPGLGFRVQGLGFRV